MGRRLGRALFCLGLLVVTLGAAVHVGADRTPDSLAIAGDRSTAASIAAIPDGVVGAMGPAFRSLHRSRFDGPDRVATLLGVVALGLIVAGAAWARGVVALPSARRLPAMVAVPAAPRAPPRSA